MLNEKQMPIFSKDYWRESAKQIKDVKMIVFAALITALRVVLGQLVKISVAPNVNITFGCYVNALGSAVYGPLMGLLVGAVSDTIGCMCKGFAGYFLPYILIDMSSSFIYALFLWRRKITPERTILSKLTVNFVSNILLTSAIMKIYYALIKDEAYNLFTLIRVVKNLVMFPIEGVLISVVLVTLLPICQRSGLISKQYEVVKIKNKLLFALEIAGLTVLAIGIVLFYIFFLREYVSAHNIKLF